MNTYLITWKHNSGFQHRPSLIRGESYTQAMHTHFHKDAVNAVMNYEGEYKLNYDSYCVVASQFDSCDFYGIAVEVSSVTTYSNQGEIVYLDDDLPF